MDIIGKTDRDRNAIPYIKIRQKGRKIRFSKKLTKGFPKPYTETKFGFAYDKEASKVYLVFLDDGLKIQKNGEASSKYHADRIMFLLGEVVNEFYVNLESPQKVSDVVERYELVPLTKERRMQLVNDAYDESDDWLR